MVVCASDIEVETDTSPIFALVWYSRAGDAEGVEGRNSETRRSGEKTVIHYEEEQVK